MFVAKYVNYIIKERVDTSFFRETKQQQLRVYNTMKDRDANPSCLEHP